jgi:outer membrane receptor protein involved in Fe transport
VHGGKPGLHKQEQDKNIKSDLKIDRQDCTRPIYKISVEDAFMIGKKWAVSTAIVTVVLCSFSAQAQVNPTASANDSEPQANPSDAMAPQETEAASDTSVNDIVVVGSRIIRDGYKAPTPLSVVGAEQLANNASSNIAQAITTMPAFSGSGNTRSGTGSGSSATGGINSLNLRSLGPNRTLVLLNGHRVPAANPSGLVDVNTLPQGLVSRVDIVTGGASSVYGSDAVAGVVNFVLDDKLLGFKGSISGGQTNYDDGKNYVADLSAGFKFGGDRGRIFLFGQHSDDDGIPGGSDREWTRRGVQNLANPAYTPTNGQPQRLLLSQVGYMNATPGGVIASGPLAYTYFGVGGEVLQLDRGAIRSDPYMQGGNWEQGDTRRLNPVAPSEKRDSAFGRVTYDITDHINLYAQVGWTRTKTAAQMTPSFMPSTSGPLIAVDNAYLPESVRARMIAAGLANIRVGTLNYDLDLLRQESRRTALVYSAGATGDLDALGSNWKWDAYAQRGTTDVHVEIPTNLSRARYALAVDAVRNAAGQIVCRSTLTNPTNGCSPYNVFGVGVNDPDGPGVAYIRSPSFQNTKVTQDVFAASLTGEPFSIWAGPVSLALSAEHRRDKAVATVDAGSAALDHPNGNYGFIDGKTSVTEGAIETVIPLLKDSKLGNNLDLNAAARYTSYSLAGNVVTWKVGLVYTPIPDIIFRVTRSRDIRAPSIQELFSPSTQTRSTIFDPFTNTVPAFLQITRGNRDLRPEKADTLGLGVVVQPSFIPGLNASVDYWRIKIDDAISNINAANTLLMCFDGTQPNLCANITRSNGILTEVVSQNINFAVQRVRGVDFEASYRLPLANVSDSLPGALTLHLNATHYIENFIDNGVAPQNFVGENSGANPPKWRYVASLAYESPTFNASLTARGFSAGKQFANYIECQTNCPTATAAHPTVNDNHMPGRTYLDAALSYNFTVRDAKLTAFFNVRNLANVDPAPSVAYTNWTNGANPLLYDVDGRVYRLGLRFQF